MAYEKFKTARDNLGLLDFSKSTHSNPAHKIKGILDGNLDPCEVSQKCDRWARSCYNTPRIGELLLCAIDDLLDCHGVEVIYAPEEESNLGTKLFEYCNTGDSYALTIAYDYRAGEHIVAGFEDMALAALQE